MTPAFAIIAAMIFAVTPAKPFNPLFHQARASCKQVSSCEEAVQIWCNGYRRADADSDGIPCENVCHSVEQVEEIRQNQGC